jgi:hypothetical protein
LGGEFITKIRNGGKKLKNKKSVLLSLVLSVVMALALIGLTGCTIIIGGETPPPEEPPEMRIALSADRTRLQSGECATLEWNVQGGFGVELNEQPVERSGQKQVCPEETTTYWLGVDTGETMERREVTIIVEGAEQPPPPEEQPPQEQPPEGQGVEFINLVVEPDVIPPGGCAVLHWEVVPPGEWLVFLNGQEVPHVGEQEVCPEETTTYELLVEAPGEPQVRTTTLHVEGEPEPEGERVEFINLVVEPDVIPPGGCAVLHWEVVPPGEWLVLLDGQEVPHVGEQEVCPEETTTYELLVEAPGEPQVRTATLHVEGEPEPEQPPTPPAGPTPTSPPSGPPSPQTVDLAVTDLYPDNLPKGKVYVRITNNGPASLTNASVELKCGGQGTPLGGQPPWSHVESPTILTISLNPGQTNAFQTNVAVDTTQYSYDVWCAVSPKTLSDPNTSNNKYSEAISSQAPPVLTPIILPSADLAVTDLYPQNQPQGEVYARITNHGPDSLTNVSAVLKCTAVKTDYSTGATTTQANSYPVSITLSLNPGQTKAFSTRILIDTSKYWYKMTCSIEVPFDNLNTNKSNDSYSETIPSP